MLTRYRILWMAGAIQTLLWLNASGVALAGEVCGGIRMPDYVCRWTEKTLTIDGKLNEPAWEEAIRLDRFFLMVGDGKNTRPPSTRTIARLLWSDKYLYFAAEMEDTDLYGSHEGHDPPFGGDDIIELFVKPRQDLPYYWEFHVTPRGATRDYFWARRGAGADDRWMAYNAEMQAAVTLDGTLNHWEDRDRGWTVEVAIPWSAFERMGGRPQPKDRWAFLVSRYDYSVHLERGLELSACTPLPQVNFHLFESYPFMVFRK